MKSASARQAIRYEAGQWTHVERQIPEETPLAITCNNQAFAAVLATPADLEDLAYGFALTEGIVDDPADISALSIHAVDEGHEARLTIPTTRSDALQDRRRAFVARTSCSLCGLEHLDALLSSTPVTTANTSQYAPETLLQAISNLPEAQRLNAQTRAVHAAGWIDRTGTLVSVREDIGRHNAVDKIAGWMFLNNISPQDKVFYTTGRLTTEMVIKTVQMQIPVLVSRSGFTAEAVDLARRAGLTLIGRAKGKRFIALSGIERIVFDTQDEDEFADAPSLQRAQQGAHLGTGK